jgi:Family of unknown function (DUF5923)
MVSRQTAMSELRALFEHFASSHSTDIIFDAATTLIDDVNNNKELRV